MKTEYDFSNGERGKFYREGAKFNLPVYLDEDVASYLQRQAKAKGKDLNEIVNDWLKEDIAKAEGK